MGDSPADSPADRPPRSYISSSPPALLRPREMQLRHPRERKRKDTGERAQLYPSAKHAERHLCAPPAPPSDAATCPAHPEGLALLRADLS